ncbi:MAG: sugar ABC transporter substrate-binding protein, partial [Phycisphaerae bacterium]|nr:sugar ABC transporter substrate-binding protein [Phycisphaerae bacterium]
MVGRGIKVGLAGVIVAAVAWWLFADTLRYHFPDRFTEPVVRFAHWGDFAEYRVWQEVIGEFHKAYPDIRVRQEYIVGFRYETKIQQQIVSGDAPDVMMFQDEPFPTFAPRGFADLSELVAASDPPIDLKREYFDTAVESFLIDGKPYGIPLCGGNVLIIWNKRCFARADKARGRRIRRPHDNWTMDEFLETARDLTIDEDGDGRIDQFGFMLPTWVYYLPFIWSHEARILDETRTQWRLVGPEAVSVFELYRRMRWEDRVCPTPIEQSEMLTDTAFFTGRIAMCVNGPWLLPFLNETSLGPREGKPPEYGITHIPFGPTGKRYTRVTWDGLCMFKDLTRERKECAWKFIRFVCGKPGQDIVARSQQSVPALKASAEAFKRFDTGCGSHKFVEAFSYSRLQPITRNWYPMDRIIYDQV